MNRAIFLDRDGTINEDTTYLNKPEDIKLLPFVIKGLKKLQDYGFELIIVTNQSGIGRGYFTEKQLHNIHDRLIQIFNEKKIDVSKIYYAPHYWYSKIQKYKSGEEFRKPNSGMLIKAASEHNIELTASYIIGDKESDIGAGINAGLKGSILIKRHGKCRNFIPDKVVKDLTHAADWIINNENKINIIIDSKKLKTLTGDLKKRNKKIITTNGVFDILHIGHLRYLKECKKKGDILIVGLNSDQSVKKIKGKTRPIINQFARAEMLIHLKPVDYVFIFPERDPIEFLKIVKPDIHVKSDDYTIGKIIERNIVQSSGGKIELTKIIKGYSTSDIINKILANEKKN